LKSFQNLILLQNLYRLKALGFKYVNSFNINEKIDYAKPRTMDELSHNITTCYLCDLSKSRTQSMVGYGNENADLMFIDFTVSQAQDNSNTYYTGRSGVSLQKMIENVLGLNIEDVYFIHR